MDESDNYNERIREPQLIMNKENHREPWEVLSLFGALFVGFWAFELIISSIETINMLVRYIL